MPHSSAVQTPLLPQLVISCCPAVLPALVAAMTTCCWRREARRWWPGASRGMNAAQLRTAAWPPAKPAPAASEAAASQSAKGSVLPEDAWLGAAMLAVAWTAAACGSKGTSRAMLVATCWELLPAGCISGENP